MASKIIAMHFIAILFLTSWAVIVGYLPSYVMSCYQNNSLTIIFYISILLILTNPFFKFFGFVASQEFVEREFTKERLKFFQSYRGEDSSSPIFSQSAFLVKEGLKISKIEIPAFFITLGIIAFVAIYKTEIYWISLSIAVFFGISCLILSLFLTNKGLKNTVDADKEPTNLYQIFIKSFPTFKYGLFSSSFKEKFNTESANTSRKYVQLLKHSIFPGAIVEFGSTSAFLIGSICYLTLSSSNLNELFPLYFQIGAITSVFLQLSSQLPTLSAYNEYKKANSASLPIGHPFNDINISITTAGFTITSPNLKQHQFNYSNGYQIIGRNGRGKTTFLRAIASKFPPDIRLIFLTSTTNLSSLNFFDSIGPISDGERQFKNIEISLSQNPKILILDEAFNCLDAEKLKATKYLLSNFLNSGGLLIVTFHAETLSDLLSIPIEDLIQFKSK